MKSDNILNPETNNIPIRILILLLFILKLSSHTFSQSVDNPNNIEHSKLIKQDSINGIYIPKDIKDCISQLKMYIPDSIVEQIKGMSEQEFTSSFHLGFGMWIRNNWGLWGGSRLQIYLMNLGLSHPDEMSDFILTYYYNWLNGNNLKVKKAVVQYRKKYDQISKVTTQFSAVSMDNKRYNNLDSALKHCNTIVEINYEHLNKLPKQILQFKNLQDIAIERSPNVNWSKTFILLSKLSKLNKVSLFDNDVKSYPDEIGIINQLNTLWIGYDPIESLPPTICQLKNLKELMITRCPKVNLRNILIQLIELDSLQELDLSEDSLKTLPIEIGNLRQLKKLMLDNNMLTEVPDGVKKLSSLEYLRLFSNKINNIDLIPGDLRMLNKIDLCYNKFTEFPVQLAAIENLENIVMWYNNIENIPKGISEIRNLKRLNLEHNNINELPNEFYSLSNLETLDLSENFLNDSTFIHLIQLKQLKELDLDRNDISEIPENINLLENLERLGLNGNSKLTRIPESFTKLTKLNSLGLGNCPNLDFSNVCLVLNNFKLIQLGFYGNNVSEANRKKLNELLPMTKIYY